MTEDDYCARLRAAADGRSLTIHPGRVAALHEEVVVR